MAIDNTNRLVRSQRNKVIAGVAGGLGEHFNVDPILIRIAFVLLALADGVGVIGYLVAWALIPKEGEVQSPAEAMVGKVSPDPANKNNTWIWVSILAIAGILIVANTTHWGWDGGVVIWALVLIGAGAWLYRRDADSRRGPDPDPPPPIPPSPSSPPSTPVVRSETTPAVMEPKPPAGPVAASGNPGEVITEATGPPENRPTPGTTTASNPGETPVASTTTLPLTGSAPRRTEVVPPVRRVLPRRPRSRLGRYTFAVALVLLGIAALAENAGVVQLSPLQYGGLLLLTIGGGLLVGTFFGRSRLLALAGLLVLALFLASGFLGRWFYVPVDAGAGDRVYAPASASELRDGYELSAGSLNIDLTQMRWTRQTVEVDASVGFGEINVLVPEGVGVDVTGRSTVGAVSLFGEERAGFGVSFDLADARAPGAPHLVLDLSAFTGQVEVARSAARARGA